MLGSVVKKELLQIASSRRLITLSILTAMVGIVVALDGWQQAAESSRLESEASHIERTTWLEQGEANPHDAAHFGRYALRPVPPLAGFDPGVFDYSGSTVWMEAHFQNPPSHRRAENLLSLYPLPTVSCAWILSSIVPLLLVVLLFGSIVKEREDGTLRLLMSQNVSLGQLLSGKCLAAIATIGLTTAVLVGIGILPMLFHKEFHADWVRLMLLLAVYFLAFVGVAGTCIVVSSVAQSSYQSFWICTLLWLLMAFGVPAIGTQVAQDAHPTLRDRTLAIQIETEAQAPFWLGDSQYEEVAMYEAEVLTRHRVTDRQELNLNRDALVLQAHERFANRVFDRLYGDLYSTHREQESALSIASLFSPILAVQRLSRGIAGTDTFAQIRFAQQAESLRRDSVKTLNEDMLYQAGTRSFEYAADRQLWETIDDFNYETASLSEVLRNYWVELTSLVVWILLSLGLVFLSAGRIQKGSIL